MQHVGAARWPAEWRDNVEFRYYLSFGYVILLAVCALGIGLYLLSIGDPAAFKYSTVFATVCAAIVFGGYVTRFDRRRSGARNIKHAPSSTRSGLRIPYSSRVFASYASIMTLIAIGFTLGLIDGVLSQSRGSTGWVVICAVLGAIFVSLPISMLAGRFALGYILITPEGVFQRGWTFSLYLPWDDVIDVTPVYRQGPYISVLASSNAHWQGHQIHKLWKQDRLPSLPAIIVPGKFLGADPAIAYQILHYYHSNPAMRSELSNSAAVDRVHAEAFPL